jgi:hypothetical protein
MGNTASSAHARIYNNILKIKNPQTRVNMIETLLSSIEYVNAAKSTGVYSSLITYIYTVKSGGSPPLLPGEVAVPVQQPPQSSGLMGAITHYTDKINPWKHVSKKPQEKVLSYFDSCLQILELDENELLTEEKLKLAYKKASIHAHPDKKSGSDEKFQAVNRAYNYLHEILKRVQGTTTMAAAAPTTQGLPAPPPVEEIIEPVTLNPKKLDMNTFNATFERVKMKTAEDEGYGNWLHTADDSRTMNTYKGSFTADNFNRAFVEQQQTYGAEAKKAAVNPSLMALDLAPELGASLVNENIRDYTSPANADLQYMDLKMAYTTGSTFTNQVIDVVHKPRTLEGYKAERENIAPLNDYERRQLEEEEFYMKQREADIQRKKADQAAQESEYFERLKKLVRTQ